MFSLQSNRTPRSRITSDCGMQQRESRLRFFMCLSSSSLLQRSNQMSSVFLWHLASDALIQTRIGYHGHMLHCSYFDFNVLKMEREAMLRSNVNNIVGGV